MNLKLSDCSPFNYEMYSRPLEGIHLCLSSGFVGDFTFSSLLIKSLKLKVPTLLISSNHSIGHYESVLRKNALEVQNLIMIGQLEIVQLVSSTSKSGLDSSSSHQNSLTWTDLEEWKRQGMNYPISSISPPFPSIHDEGDATRTTTIPSSSSSSSALRKSYAIFIDDLEAFELLAPSSKIARMFLSDICTKTNASSNTNTKRTKSLPLGTSNAVPSIQCFAAYGRQSFEPYAFDMGLWIPSILSSSYTNSQWINSSSNSELLLSSIHEEEEEPRLSEYLKYRADMIIITSPLATGYSVDTHGSLTITSTKTIKRQTYLFKALDSGIRCNMVGSAFKS